MSEPVKSVTDHMASKLLDPKEFRANGYLQEVNRQFFHPLGLALATGVNEDGTEFLYGICDHRDDPEGTVFCDLSDESAKAKATFVLTEAIKRQNARAALFGCTSIQPIGTKFPMESKR